MPARPFKWLLLLLLTTMTLGTYIACGDLDDDDGCDPFADSNCECTDEDDDECDPDDDETGTCECFFVEDDPEPEAPQNASVDVSTSGFSPKTVTISRGGTVTFTNKGPTGIQHVLVFDDNSIGERNDGEISLLMDNQSVPETFNTVGTFTYYERINGSPNHESLSGGRVIVEDTE